MWIILISALSMGMIGSLHCVGMCGPLAFALPFPSQKTHVRFLGSLLYNIGRIVTYAIIGCMLGWLGKSFAIAGWQQWLSILLGSTLLAYYLLPKLVAKTTINHQVFTWMGNGIRKALGHFIQHKSYGNLFLFGLINGLLPCGLVYAAAATATAMAQPLKGLLFMAGFGLGTLPAMWCMIFFSNQLSYGFRSKIKVLYPYMITLMACLLIIRGLGLGIPYVSPHLSNKAATIISCH